MTDPDDGLSCDNGERRMQRLDHSMIYVLIAGTYTPIAALALIAVALLLWKQLLHPQ